MQKIKLIAPYPTHAYLKIIQKSMEKYDKKLKIIPYNSHKEIISNLKEDGNIFHIHWLENFDLDIVKALKIFLIFLIHRIKNKKILIQIHNSEPHEKMSNSHKILIFFLYMLANKLIVMSRFQKDGFKKNIFKYKKIEIAQHPNFIDFYENRTDKVKSREKLKLPKNKFIFGYLGLVRPYKNIEKLLKIFSSLKTNDILVICGRWVNQNYKNKTVQKYSQNKRIIIIDKYIPDNEIQYYLNAMDLVVFTYKKITNSGSAFLALSFFKPIIIPEICSLKELKDEKHPFSLTYKNDKELIEKMKLAKKINLEEFSKNAKKFIKKYDSEIIGKQLYDSYMN